ncbi:hypothetical protein UK23_30860 [Lentzea aerocolonigenes]|uniref:Uncharacterized protein n=1 Tax=Lentzea aerocolonigenes TaxID=68170 RepID=A0A0F0GRN2_LENAE|nr:hypothetical protein UK23_30860 [Lentzea aerocolonigenes]
MTKYVIGPDVAVRLAHDQAVIGAGHQLLAPGVSARSRFHIRSAPMSDLPMLLVVETRAVTSVSTSS